MATYTDMQQRNMDRRSERAKQHLRLMLEMSLEHTRPTVKELAEHYDGRVPQWFIDTAGETE